MKKLLLVLTLISLTINAQVGIGTTTPNNSAQLDVTATNKGVLIPRMTQAQKNAILTPATSLLVYQTNGTPGYYYYNGTNWIRLSNVKKIDDLLDGKSDNDGTNNGSSVFLGVSAGLVDDATDNKNVGIGFESLKDNTNGDGNTAIGRFSLRSNVSGFGNTAIGNQAQYIAKTGRWNVSVGLTSLGKSNGEYNTAIGSLSLSSLKTGNNNVGIGTWAGHNDDNSFRNVYVGVQSGGGSNTNLPIENKSDNVFLGYYSGYNENGSNKLYIENSDADADNALIYGEFNNNILRINGELQLGTGGAANRYAFPTADGATNQVLTTDGAGQMSFTNVSSVFTEIGDISGVIAGNGLIGGALSGIATIHVAATNGLTTTANDIRWGGTLIQDTNINYGNFDTRFNLNGLGDFIIQDNGTGKFEIKDTGRATFGDDTYWRDINIAGTIIASLTDDGNDGRFRIMENGITSVDLDANTQFIFNEQGLDRNFRIESNLNTNMFFMDAGLNRVSIGTNFSAGTFNVFGNSYFSDDIILRDGAVNTGDTLIKIYDSADDGVIDINENNAMNHRIHGNGTTIFNEQGIALDFRIESDTRQYMFMVDGSDNLVRIGNRNTGGTPEQGNTRLVNGITTTVDYVADFQRSSSNNGTAVGIGSTEFLLDAGNLYVMLHGRLLPFTDAAHSLGTSNWRWSALWATDGTINTSDLRQKKNIKPLSYGLDDLMKIETITFKWKNMANKDTKIGFSAQNLLEVLPEVVKTHELVTVDEETGREELRPVGNLGVYYSDIIPVTVKAIQELKNEVDSLKEENKTLKQQLSVIKQLEQRLKTLESKN